MSAFDGEPQPVVPNTEAAPTNQEGVISELVGEGKKFNSIEALALGKIESDKYIANLERQNRELQEDVGKKEYAKELLDQLRNKAADPVPASTVAPESVTTGPIDSTTPPVLSEEDLKSLVEETLVSRDRAAVAKANVETVDRQLTEMFGTEAAAKIEAKSQELNLTKERLQEIAAESPAAFMSLIGEAPKPNPLVTQGTVNTSSVLTESNERNSAYYQKLRREDPKSYHSVKISQQMFADAERLGDSFYN